MQAEQSIRIIMTLIPDSIAVVAKASRVSSVTLHLWEDFRMAMDQSKYKTDPCGRFAPKLPVK